MATFDECLAIIKKAAGDIITDKQAMDLLEEIYSFAQKKKDDGLDTETIDAALDTHIKTIEKELILQATIKKRNAYLNTIIRDKLEKYIDGFGDQPGTAIQAIMGGTTKMFPGGRLSIDAAGRALQQKYLGRLIYELEEANLFPIFNKGLLDREIAQELWEIRPGGNPGVTGDKNALKIAEIIHKQQEAARLRSNRAGSFIRRMPGWI